ncbi:MAG TPA: tetratricopeptide repeat protein [Steroidobacteraceae bacterium]|nr:tetratricopeptide repeat protein [Steroidobacteraceae bacterium]
MRAGKSRRGNRVLAALIVAVAAVACAAPAAAVTDEERALAYTRFRALFDAGKYAEALPVAEQLVAATEQQYGDKDRSLANPLANVGTTQLRLGHFAAAEAAYQRALTILDAVGTTTDRARLRPLQGLGLTYARSDRLAPAAETLKQAVDLSRNLDGLYNLEQLDFVRALIDVYVAQNRLEDAEREHQYAFRIAESAYGKGDPRMLPAYDYLARWYEYVGRYATARVEHMRALRLAEATSGRGSVPTIGPLRGIARAYRLEYLYGPEVTQESTAESPTLFNTGPGTNQSQPRLNPEGEKALQLALRAAQKANPPVPALLGATLVDWGDWQLTAGNGRESRNAYRSAWNALQASGDTKLVNAPRQLRYKPPSSSIARFTGGDVEDYEEFTIEAKFTVRADGRTAEIVISPNEAPREYGAGVETAIRKALYAPRLANGEPVETTGVTLSERVLVRKPGQQRASP